MRKILVMTDIHIRDANQTIIDLDPLDCFERALNHAEKHHSDAEHLIIMGDLTHSGKPIEYERFKEALSNFSIRYTLMAGNHDNRQNLHAAFPNQSFMESGHLQTRVEVGDHVFLTLDTLADPENNSTMHSGYLCTKRLNWLSDQLEASNGQSVCVCMHHPAHKTGFEGMDVIRLENHEDFYNCVRPFKNLKHILAGHVHRTISGTANGIGYSMLKSTCHQMPLIFKNKESSLSVPEPGAYGVILLSDDNFIAHTEDFPIAIHSDEPRTDALPNG